MAWSRLPSAWVVGRSEALREAPNMSDDSPRSVRRQRARSERVSYGDPVVLHETSRTRVVLVPFFVPHTDRTELAIKLVTYRKGVGALEWAIVEDKSISMQEQAARALLSALRTHLAVAQESSDDGSYLVIPVGDGVADLGAHDPGTIASALARVLGQGDIAAHLDGANLSDELVAAMRGAIRVREMQDAVAKLRTHLDAGVTDERVFQAWCNDHSWAFGNAYVMRDEVRDISSGDSVDVLLPTVIAGYRDIVELKRPDAKILRWDESHRNFYFSADVARAIGQCHRYLDVLHEVAQRGLRDHPEVVAYHPRAVIVIGRSHDWGEEKLKALHGLNARLAGLTVMSYDHLLNQGERLLQMIAVSELSPPDEYDEFDMFDDEEPPF